MSTTSHILVPPPDILEEEEEEEAQVQATTRGRHEDDVLSQWSFDETESTTETPIPEGTEEDGEFLRREPFAPNVREMSYISRTCSEA